jgi:transcription antitermination factor NusG
MALNAMQPINSAHGEDRWYAFRTRSRHEKKATLQLQEAGIETFLPVASQVREWSDRRKIIELPLFPGYGFARINYLGNDRIRVLSIHGIVSFVGPNGCGTPVPDQQIQDLRKLMHHKTPCQPHPYIAVGRRVRIRGGALDGVEGVLTEQREDRSLVISLTPIERAVSIRIEGYELDVI